MSDITKMIDFHIQALRNFGCAVVVLTPEDIITLTEDDEGDPTITYAEAETWMHIHHHDVEEALLGDYWSESVCPLFDLYPIKSVCPNDDAGKHSPDEHGECDDCRAVLPTVKLNFNPQAWVRDYAISVDPEGDTTWTVPKALFLELFPTEADFNSNHHERDDLRHKGNAPQWVRDWSGPFEVELLDTEIWDA